MARIRTIKPEFWTDGKILECSVSTRLLFIGLWCFADDEGNIEGGPTSIKAKIFPCDNIKVAPLLSELCEQKLITSYGVEGENYFHINNFHKHQNINRKSKNRCPLYEDSMSTPPPLTEDSALEVVSSKGSSKGSNKPYTGISTDDPIKVAFEKDWSELPRKAGDKKKAFACYAATVGKDLKNKRQEFRLKLDQLLIESVGREMRHIKTGETFMRNWQTIEFDNRTTKSHKKTPDGIPPAPDLNQQESLDQIKKQFDFVQKQYNLGEAPDDANWLRMALGKYVEDYEREFNADPLTHEQRRWAYGKGLDPSTAL